MYHFRLSDKTLELWILMFGWLGCRIFGRSSSVKFRVLETAMYSLASLLNGSRIGGTSGSSSDIASSIFGSSSTCDSIDICDATWDSSSRPAMPGIVLSWDMDEFKLKDSCVCRFVDMMGFSLA